MRKTLVFVFTSVNIGGAQMSWTRLAITTTALAFSATLAQAADMPVKARPALPPAQEQASGYVEVYGGWARTTADASLCEVGFGCEVFSDRFNGWALGGAGRGNYWFSPNMSVQLDAQAEGTSYKFTDGSFQQRFTNHSYLIGGHANWRNSQTGLLGIFAGAGDAGGFGSQRHFVFGGEGQLYWNQLTLYLQGGYDTTLGDNFVETHAWFIRGTGRYFITPNTMLEGTVLYANGELDFNENSGIAVLGFQTWLWEAKLEHRFANPFSLFVKYRGSETKYDTVVFEDFTSNFKVRDHRVLVGLRLYMGQDTLLANDRRGATLDIIDPLGIQSGPLMFGPRVGVAE